MLPCLNSLLNNWPGSKLGTLLASAGLPVGSPHSQLQAGALRPYDLLTGIPSTACLDAPRPPSAWLPQPPKAADPSLRRLACIGWLRLAATFLPVDSAFPIVDSWCLSYFQPSLEGQFWLNLRHLEWELGAGSSHLGPQGMRQAQSSGLRQRL